MLFCSLTVTGVVLSSAISMEKTEDIGAGCSWRQEEKSTIKRPVIICLRKYFHISYSPSYSQNIIIILNQVLDIDLTNYYAPLILI